MVKNRNRHRALRTSAVEVVLLLLSFLVLAASGRSLASASLLAVLLAAPWVALRRWESGRAMTVADPSRQPQPQSLPTATPVAPGPLQQLGSGIVPIWARQTEAARWQSEQAIMGLTDQFASMQQTLRQASGMAGVEGTLAVRRTLRDMAETITNAVYRSEMSLQEWEHPRVQPRRIWLRFSAATCFSHPLY